MKPTSNAVTRQDVSLLNDGYVLCNPQNEIDRQHHLPDGSPGYNHPVLIRNSGESQWKENVSIARNNSKFFAIELVTAGDLIFVQNGREYLLKPGTAFFLKKGGNHIYSVGPSGFVKKSYLGFGGTLLDILTAELGFSDVDICQLSNTTEFEQYIKQAFSLLAKESDAHALFELTALGFKALFFISQNLIKSSMPTQLLAAMDYMRRNLATKITVKDICAAAGMGKSPFFRLWAQHSTQTPFAWLTTLRMNQCAALLAHTSTPIKEIALLIGCDDLQYFSKIFKKEKGVAPKEYRKKFGGIKKEAE